MKVKKTKLIQKAKGRKKGKYEITLEVSDYDIEMFEDFAMTYVPFEVAVEPSEKNHFTGIYKAEYKEKYQKWLSKVWGCFWKLWSIYE